MTIDPFGNDEQRFLSAKDVFAHNYTSVSEKSTTRPCGSRFIVGEGFGDNALTENRA